MNKQRSIQVALLIGILILINILASAVYDRFDLTREGRFSLTDATKDMLQDLEEPVYIKIYLEGELPAGFKRLQNATREMLDEFRAYSGNKIEYEFINPTEGRNGKEKQELYQQLAKKGLNPVNLRVEEEGDLTQKIIFPGATVASAGKEIPVQLLQNQVGMGAEQSLNNSIALLEYKLANAIDKASEPGKAIIAVSAGHGEAKAIQLADFASSLQDYYNVERIDIRNELYIPALYKVLIIADPDSPFVEQDKFKIDQYIMNGGKVLWLLDGMKADMDSLQGKDFFVAQDLNLNLQDQLFKYGVRINPNLVQDLQCAQIPIVVGQTGNVPQTQLFPWMFFPISIPHLKHPIVRNLDAVLFRFVSSVDTVGAKNIKKEVLLTSSQYSKPLYTPARVHLSMLRFTPDPARFNHPDLPLAVLLAGEFESVFKNRLTARTLSVIDTMKGVSYREKSKPTKMIVVGDGEIIKNEVSRDGRPFPLGFYDYTKQTFANKEFLQNCIEYLAARHTGVIEARNKEVRLRLLDKTRIKEEKTWWKAGNIALPIIIVVIFGLIYNFIRSRKYSK